MLKATDRCQQVLISEASISASLTPQVEQMLQVWVCTLPHWRVAHAIVWTQIMTHQCRDTNQTGSSTAAALCWWGNKFGPFACALPSSGGNLNVSRSLMQLEPFAKMPEVPAGLLQQTNVSKNVRVWQKWLS